jgi:hypothetical protein
MDVVTLLPPQPGIGVAEILIQLEHADETPLLEQISLSSTARRKAGTGHQQHPNGEVREESNS